MHKFICDKKKITSKSKSSHLNEVINAKVQNLNAKANNIEVKAHKIEDDDNPKDLGLKDLDIAKTFDDPKDLDDVKSLDDPTDQGVPKYLDDHKDLGDHKDLVQGIIEDIITNVIESQNNNTKKQRSMKRSNSDTAFSRNSYVKRRKKVSISPTKAETTTTTSTSSESEVRNI